MKEYGSTKPLVLVFLVGFFALLTTLLADKNINIWEAATTYKQNIFIIYESDLAKAYETLKNLIEFYKKLSS